MAMEQNYLKVLISHEIQGFFNLLDGAGTLAAEAATGLSTIEVVRTFLKGRNVLFAFLS